MSRVTNVILLTSIGESGVWGANQWLANNRWPQLFEISGHAGGDKAMQCEVWAAAINHFDIDAFAKALASVEWESPGCVQLLVKDEHEERFALLAGKLLDRTYRFTGLA